MLSRYALATREFSAGGGYLRLKVGSRIWRRDAVKEEIRFDAGSSSIVFLKNSGPFADSLLRGDFVSIEVGLFNLIRGFIFIPNNKFKSELLSQL